MLNSVLTVQLVSSSAPSAVNSLLFHKLESTHFTPTPKGQFPAFPAPAALPGPREQGCRAGSPACTLRGSVCSLGMGTRPLLRGTWGNPGYSRIKAQLCLCLPTPGHGHSATAYCTKLRFQYPEVLSCHSGTKTNRFGGAELPGK